MLRTVNGELPKMVENRVQECIMIQLELKMMFSKNVYDLQRNGYTNLIVLAGHNRDKGEM